MAQQRGAGAWVLWPLSLLYGALVALRRQLYARGVLTSQRLPVPVVVVGNVVAGGAGKTPTVVALVRHLSAKGWRPGVVSRGYGRASDGIVEVQRDTPASLSGDEPALIHRATGVPVFVGRDRVAAARRLLAAHPGVNLLVCDDGLQHLALARDVAVIVFDERGAGNGWLLPAGLLREAWPGSAHTAATGCVVLQQHRDQRPPAPVAMPAGMPAFCATRRLADHALNAGGERTPLSALRGHALTAVAGIARPEAFFDMLRAQGLTIEHEVALADHADAAAYASVLGARTPIVCTEKDAVKLFELVRPLGPARERTVWTVPLEIDPEPGFLAAVQARLALPPSR